MKPITLPLLGLPIHISNLSFKKVTPIYSFYLCIIQKNIYLVLDTIDAIIININRHSSCPQGAYNLKEETETHTITNSSL